MMNASAPGSSFRICDSELWDTGSFWHSANPQWSPCFRDTILVWVPCLFFTLVIFNETLAINRGIGKHVTPISWNPFNILRLVITISITLLNFTEVASYLYDLIICNNNNNSNYIHAHDAEGATIVGSSISAPAIRGLCYAALAIIYIFHRKVGRHTSGPVWFYLLLALICDSIDFYSVVSSNRAAIYNRVEQIVKFTHFPLIILLFLLECHGDYGQVEYDPSDARPVSNELTASFFSKLTFWWFGAFFQSSREKKVTLSSLWRTLNRDKAVYLVPQFQRAWLKPNNSPSQTYKLSDGTTQASQKLTSVLLKLLWPDLLIATIFKLIADTFDISLPLLLKLLLDYMGDHEAPTWHGFLYASLFLLLPSLSVFLSGHQYFLMNLVGIQSRTMIVGSVYRKSLAMGSSVQTGGVVNLMSVDAQRLQDTAQVLNNIWSSPYQVIVTTMILYWLLGWTVFFGVGSMLLTLPYFVISSNKIKDIQIKLMKIKDERVKLSNELLNGIKIVKLYGWEESFMEKLVALRQKEVDLLDKILKIEKYQMVIWQVGPVFVTIITFALIFFMDTANILTPVKAFVGLALFVNLRTPLAALPIVVSTINQTKVSVQRLEKYLNCDELTKYVTRNKDEHAVSILDATLSWSSTNPKPTLNNLNLKVKHKEFMAVIGQVASGKSSFLSAILGEMHKSTGTINVCGSLKVAYVPQQAWMQNMTIRDNILFGSAYDEKRYKQVLYACSLEADLKNLPGGDMSEIGERGINLSGGQKQRVSLARACYSNSDLYLLDDPLSALDSHVAKHIYKNVLSSSTGLLKDKTRILATNSLFVLPHTDRIVVLQDGKVLEVGTYDKLSLSQSSQLYEYSRIYSKLNEAKEASPVKELDPEQPMKNESPTKPKTEKQAAGADSGKLIDSEKEEQGIVDVTVYANYIKAYTLICFLVTVVGYTVCQLATVAATIWISTWTWGNDSNPEEPDSRGLKLGVYATIGGVQLLGSYMGNVGIEKGIVRAAKRLHHELIIKILHSPMTFFETTPLGRILDRLAKDLDVIDFLLHTNFRIWFISMLIFLTSLLVISAAFPIFLIVTIPITLGFYQFQRVFVSTTRQLKRLEAITRSPIFSHFEGTVSGLTSVRAYERVQDFIATSDQLIDTNQSCSYPNLIASRWSAVILEMTVSVLIAFTAFMCVYYKGDITAGQAGLTVTLAVNLATVLGTTARQTSELESNTVSIERLMSYKNNKLEDDWVKEKRPPASWPSKGAIKFKNYSTRYRENTDLVLRDLSIDINPAEKIGIVGRTGSGKSTLSLSLFRILEAYTGRITIDGLNLADYGLHDIRMRLTIIPQDPVLFSGTIRFNLDPLKLYSDLEIWEALERANLKAYISSLGSGLEHEVSEFGKNFSLGQRQLICLARAILRKSKILVLDEATASVDLETDTLVQRTIRQVFTDCSILTIAHRLHTILDSDRILVLNGGRLEEMDAPRSLLANPNSEFHSLARDAGIDIGSIVDQQQK